MSDIFRKAYPAGGAPRWPIVTMLEIVFVQKCFGLSDPTTEELLRGRTRFRRFVNLGFDDKTPEHGMISVFRLVGNWPDY